jgi:hypothetical protein
MSTSTGAPAAFARSDGIMLPTKGTAAAVAATPPTMPVPIKNTRLLLSTLLSDMKFPAGDWRKDDILAKIAKKIK